jgi:hypothetical protein
MTNIDWVKERAACSLSHMFEQLKLDIKNDIATRNSLREEKQNFEFKSVESGNALTVIRQGLMPETKVTFSINRGQLFVTQDGKDVLTAVVTLNDEGECLFVVKNKEREAWQVRKMALEGIFFVGL